MSTTDASDFVERFAAAWADPSPEAFAALSHEDAVYVQPIEPTTRIRAQADAFVRRLLAMVPDLRGEILRWAAHDDVVYVSLRLRGTFGGRPIQWVTVDEIVLDDGRIRSRVANFDGVALIRQILARPRGWPAFVRSRLA